MGKRYYWLKLKEDFFRSKEIKKLRKQKRGDTCTVIYLKMQLQALKTEGVLRWSGLEERFTAELALDLDEKEAVVAETLQYLLESGLAEMPDGKTLVLPSVLENTGSEQDSSQRVREYRRKQRALQCNAGVTQVKRTCNAEKEKDNTEKKPEQETTEEESRPKAADFPEGREHDGRHGGQHHGDGRDDPEIPGVTRL